MKYTTYKKENDTKLSHSAPQASGREKKKCFSSFLKEGIYIFFFFACSLSLSLHFLYPSHFLSFNHALFPPFIPSPYPLLSLPLYTSHFPSFSFPPVSLSLSFCSLFPPLTSPAPSLCHLLLLLSHTHHTNWIQFRVFVVSLSTLHQEWPMRNFIVVCSFLSLSSVPPTGNKVVDRGKEIGGKK